MDTPGPWCLFGTIICILATTFFSTANLALRQISWIRLEEACDARQISRRLQSFRNHQARWISATALLRLLTNLAVLLGIVYWFNSALDRPLAVGPTVRAFVVSALVLSLCSVAVPHAWSRHAGATLLVHSYRLLWMTGLFVSPFTTVLSLPELIWNRLGHPGQNDTNGRLDEKQEELLNVVEEGKKEGVVDEEEREMIESVLEFRDTTVDEIMTPRTEIIGIDINSNLPIVVETIIARGHSRYPVYEESIDNIIGMLYAKDMLYDLQGSAEPTNLRQRLREPYFVHENKTLRDLLHNFQNQKVHLAVVLDEYGGTAGVVTIEDILEEIVGEIIDEYEPPQTESLRRIDDRTIEVDARYKVDALNDEFDLDIPEDEDYETIGGFAFARLGCIPKKDHSFILRNLRFVILEAGQRKINRLRIEFIETNTAEDAEEAE